MRVSSNFRYEDQQLATGSSHVIGCDEVGRGCLAGPVVAAAVILDPFLVHKEQWYTEIADSKSLLPAKRTILAQQIQEQSLGWGLGIVSPSIIDRINIHNASLKAMKQAIESVAEKLSSMTKSKKQIHVAVDGKFEIPKVEYAQQAIIKGDTLVMSISAASIIAKVYRDALMSRLHLRYPAYGFMQHKGYATQHHRRMLQKYGLSAVHRHSFCGKIL